MDVVVNGTPVHQADVYATAEWWVVYAEAEGFKCVYGGRAGTVRRCLEEHALYGRLVTVVAYPFAEGQESLLARVQIEKHYLERCHVENRRHVRERGRQEYAGGVGI